MNKAFSQGNWDAGMLAGIKAVRGYLDGESGSPDNPSSGSGEDSWLLFLLLFGVIGFTMFYLWLNIRRQRRCPKCHNQTMKVISRRTIAKYPTYHIEEIVSCCSNCGHYVRKEQRVDDENNHHHGRRSGPFGGGIFMGGGFGRGGGFGGGGFGGGSFGGGSFGGGGAGSKF